MRRAWNIRIFPHHTWLPYTILAWSVRYVCITIPLILYFVGSFATHLYWDYCACFVIISVSVHRECFAFVCVCVCFSLYAPCLFQHTFYHRDHPGHLLLLSNETTICLEPVFSVYSVCRPVRTTRCFHTNQFLFPSDFGLRDDWHQKCISIAAAVVRLPFTLTCRTFSLDFLCIVFRWGCCVFFSTSRAWPDER